MHLAVTHHTAAEIIYQRADAEQQRIVQKIKKLFSVLDKIQKTLEV